MALFKPVYGSVILPKKTVDGYAYVHTETGEFFADVNGGKRVQISGQYAQALRTVVEDDTNNKYITTLINAGDTNKPVYFKDGIPIECKTLALNTTGQAGSVAYSLTVKDNGTACYSFNGAAARTLNFKNGNEITVATDANGNVTVNHNTKATAATIGEGGTSRTLGWGGTFNIPSVTYNEYGHVTGSGSITLTMPGNPNTHYSAKLYLGVADGTANATTVISDPYLFVRENGSNTAVQLKGGTGINISGINGAATISLANTTVTAGTYGPSTDVSGANGNVIKVP